MLIYQPFAFCFCSCVAVCMMILFIYNQVSVLSYAPSHLRMISCCHFACQQSTILLLNWTSSWWIGYNHASFPLFCLCSRQRQFWTRRITHWRIFLTKMKPFKNAKLLMDALLACNVFFNFIQYLFPLLFSCYLCTVQTFFIEWLIRLLTSLLFWPTRKIVPSHILVLC